MFKALAWKEWREQRPVVVAGCAVAAALPPLIIAGLSFDGEDPSSTELLAALPAALVVVVWPLFAAAAGAITIATESGDGTLRFLLSRPVSRRRVWAVKVASAGCAVAVIALVSLLVLWIVHRVALPGAGPRGFGAILGGSVYGVLDLSTLASGTLLLFSCAVFASTLLDRPLTAAAAGLVLALILLSGIFVTWPWLATWPRLGPLVWLGPGWLAIGILLLAAVVLLASLAIFARAEPFRGGGVAPDASGGVEERRMGDVPADRIV